MQAQDQQGMPAWVGGMWGVAPNWARARREDGSAEETEVEEFLDEHLASDTLPRAYHLTNPDFWLAGVSSTFHGRDVFAPVAAHLASGAHPDRMGEQVPISSLVTLPTSGPRVSGSGHDTAVTGQVVHLDRFGNIITNLPDRLLTPLLEGATSAPVIEISGHHIFGLATSYADVREGQPLALMGSEGLLEIAMRNANAAQRMKVRVGDLIRLIVNMPDA